MGQATLIPPRRKADSVSEYHKVVAPLLCLVAPLLCIERRPSSVEWRPSSA